jgi:hypothetical protein
VVGVDREKGVVMLATAPQALQLNAPADVDKFHVGMRMIFTIRRPIRQRIAGVFRAAWMAWRRP